MDAERCTQIVLSSEYTLTLEGLRLIFRQTAEIEVVGEAETIFAIPKTVRELRPDVALMEFGGASRAHGLRAAAEIVEQSPKTHVLVLTTNSDPAYVRSMLACGVSAYLLKNCTTVQLFTAIQNVARGGRFIDPALGTDLVWRALDRQSRNARPQFSRRELEVFKVLVRGYTNLQTAQLLGISIKTVETHRSRLYRKLDVHSRAELVEYALAHRLPIDNFNVT